MREKVEATEHDLFGSLHVATNSKLKYSVQVDILVLIAYQRKITFKIRTANHNGTPAIIGVEREQVCLSETAIQEKDDVLLRVVDEPERRDAARLQPQIAHHALGRGEAEFARRGLPCCLQLLFEAVLQVVDVQIVVAIEADEIMLIAFVVAQEDIFAMHTAVILPPSLGFFDGFAFGVSITRERDIAGSKPLKHSVSTGTDGWKHSELGIRNYKLGI